MAGVAGRRYAPPAPRDLPAGARSRPAGSAVIE